MSVPPNENIRSKSQGDRTPKYNSQASSNNLKSEDENKLSVKPKFNQVMPKDLSIK
jgi:hypothetical protein